MDYRSRGDLLRKSLGSFGKGGIRGVGGRPAKRGWNQGGAKEKPLRRENGPESGPPFLFILMAAGVVSCGFCGLPVV
jgi:hypothetical protein